MKRPRASRKLTVPQSRVLCDAALHYASIGSMPSTGGTGPIWSVGNVKGLSARVWEGEIRVGEMVVWTVRRRSPELDFPDEGDTLLLYPTKDPDTLHVAVEVDTIEGDGKKRTCSCRMTATILRIAPKSSTSAPPAKAHGDTHFANSLLSTYSLSESSSLPPKAEAVVSPP